MSEDGFDIRALGQALSQGTLPARSVLARSWEDPEGFQHALFDEAAKCFGVSKCRPAESYDFYHDLISRHLGKRAIALQTWDAQGRAVALSYDGLDRAVAHVCQQLRAQGVVKGDALAIVQPVGALYLTGLLAGLRLGLVVTCVEPHGRSHVQHQLDRLEPTHVLADAQHAWYVQGRPVLSLESPSTADFHDLGSHSYTAADPVLRLISAFDGEHEGYCELNAEQAYLPLLRDAVLVLPLRAAERVAAPGLAVEQYQPYLLLATLLVGGCYVAFELPEDDETLHARLHGLELNVLGLSAELLTRLERQPRPIELPALRSWFRNPLEPAPRAALQRFVVRQRERPVAGFDLVADAAHGGALLCSAKSLHPDALKLVPVPGLDWQLTALNLSGTPALFDVGIFAPTVPDDSPITRAGLMIAGADDAYVLGGSVAALRAGRAYPVQLVAAVIMRQVGVDYAAVVMLRDPSLQHASISVALVFVNPGKPADARARAPGLVTRLRAVIAEELGADRVPDRMQVYPLTPRLVDGQPDARWCAAQLSDGMLELKARSRAACALSALRRQLS